MGPRALATTRHHMARLHLLLLALLHASLAAAYTFVPRAPLANVRCCQSPSAIALTGSQKRTLRSHAGRLAASKSLTYLNVADVESSRAEADVQLAAKELIRCKFAVEKKAEAKVMAGELASLTGATVAEVLGHTALLYRPGPKLPLKSL